MRNISCAIGAVLLLGLSGTGFAMTKSKTAPGPWTNPNVPPRVPVLEPAHYPSWSDPDAKLTSGTPTACDPVSFLTQWAKGDALDAFLASEENGSQSTLKDFFNGHPIRFPSGRILFPVGVGNTKAANGDGAKRLEEVSGYMAKEKLGEASSLDSSLQNCTTYFNEGNKDAEKAFQWIYIPTNMKGKTTDPAVVQQTEQVFDDAFAKMAPHLLACEGKISYFAFGCQAAFERTPTVLAMILKEMGCSTDNSVFIADMLLGQNDIPLETRKAIVEQTRIEPETQTALQSLFFGSISASKASPASRKPARSR